MKLGSRLVIGAVAGFAATMVMTAAMRRAHAKLPAKERYPLPPREIVDSALDPPRDASPDITIAAHFAYGAACGALIAAANPRISKSGGSLAGAAIWLTSYMGWLPALNILEPATRHPIRRNAAMLAAHLSWGWSTAQAIHELAAARDTIFSGGPDRDAAGNHQRRRGRRAG